MYYHIYNKIFIKTKTQVEYKQEMKKLDNILNIIIDEVYDIWI